MKKSRWKNLKLRGPEWKSLKCKMFEWKKLEVEILGAESPRWKSWSGKVWSGSVPQHCLVTISDWKLLSAKSNGHPFYKMTDCGQIMD